MSQAVGVRVIKRLSNLVRPEQRDEVCRNLSEMELELQHEVDTYLKRRDYDQTKRSVDELVFLGNVQYNLCPAKPRK